MLSMISIQIKIFMKIARIMIVMNLARSYQYHEITATDKSSYITIDSTIGTKGRVQTVITHCCPHMQVLTACG